MSAAAIVTDRPLAPDVERGAALIRSGAILDSAGRDLFPKLEAGA